MIWGQGSGISPFIWFSRIVWVWFPKCSCQDPFVCLPMCIDYMPKYSLDSYWFQNVPQVLRHENSVVGAALQWSLSVFVQENHDPSLPWVRNNTLLHFSVPFRWCHPSIWPLVGCGSYSSCLWSFVLPLLGRCDLSTGQTAQPGVLHPTSWSLQVTGARMPSQSSIRCSGPPHSGQNS